MKAPLQIISGVWGGGERPVDSLYKDRDDYYLLDVDWVLTATHPMHCIGKMIKEEKDKWTFSDGDNTFVVTPMTDETQKGFFEQWKNVLKEEFSDIDSAEFMRRSYGLETIERIV